MAVVSIGVRKNYIFFYITTPIETVPAKKIYKKSGFEAFLA